MRFAATDATTLIASIAPLEAASTTLRAGLERANEKHSSKHVVKEPFLCHNLLFALIVADLQ